MALPGKFARFWPVRCRCACICRRPARRFRFSCRACSNGRHSNPICNADSYGQGRCPQTAIARLLIEGRPVGDFCIEHRSEIDEMAEWVKRGGKLVSRDREWVKPPAAKHFGDEQLDPDEEI